MFKTKYFWNIGLFFFSQYIYNGIIFLKRENVKICEW